MITKKNSSFRAGVDQLVISYFLETDKNLGSYIFVTVSGFIILFALVCLVFFIYSRLIFGILLLILGSYLLLAIALNERQIWLRRGKLVLIQRPLPLSLETGFELSLIDELLINEVRMPPARRFDICLKLKNGRTEIFTSASNLQEAKEIKEVVELAISKYS